MKEDQLQILMERFRAKPYLGKGDKRQLAKSLNISEEKIRWWFNNRRVSMKAKTMESKSESLISKVQSKHSLSY